MHFLLILFLLVGISIAFMPLVDAYEVKHVQPWKDEPIVAESIQPGIENVSDPNAYGKITFSENEFKLYRGSLIYFPVIVEMHDYIHKPTLEIVYDEVIIKQIDLYNNGDIFQSIILLDDNWESGNYEINLKHQNNILDTSSFLITRDNETPSELIFFFFFNTVEPYISITPSIISFNDHPKENFLILGQIDDSRTGHKVNFEITTPDNKIIFGSVQTSSNGSFTNTILIDKNWVSGEYFIDVKYLNTVRLSSSFTIENNGISPIFLESNLIGSFSVSSETSNDYTILGISGNIETTESEMILHITKNDIIMFEDTLSLDGNSFQTSTVLYDYEQNMPWDYGEYQITGLIGEESFHSQFFSLDEQSFSVLEITSMDLFLNLGGNLEKLVDATKIEISHGEQKQITLSGIIENYSSGDRIDVHLVNPDGVDTISHIFASSTGSYYMPIIIDDTWVSGDYNAYVTYGNFMDTPSLFEVVNDTIIDEKIILESNDDEIILEDLKNYMITLNSSKSVDSVHYTVIMNSYHGKTPITITLNDELVQEEFSFSGIDGFIDYYLLLDDTWVSGDYVVSYIENNISVPFGTFSIENTYIVNDKMDEELSEELVLGQPLTLSNSMFKSSSHVVEYLEFSGKLVDGSTKKVSILLDGNLQTIVPLDSEGNYGGTISLGDNLASGFHNLSISSGNVAESAEFLIATNYYISLEGDLEIFRNSIAESGGEISIFLTEMVPDFVPSEVQSVIITVEGDDFYKRFSIIPKGYGFYSQNFMIGDSLGQYDVSVKYGADIIESYSIDVLLPNPEWIKFHTSSWLNGETSDYSYFKKIVLMLDDDYDVTPNVTSPDWFSEAADKWMKGLMDDDSFNNAILFLAENRLL